MTPSSPAILALPWLVAAWIATVVVVAALIYLIARGVLSKTDPQRLPEVLRALTPLLNGIAKTMTQLPTSLSADQKPPLSAPTGQTEGTAPESAEETS